MVKLFSNRNIQLLKESKLVEKLTEIMKTVPSLIFFRLICLSEIPFIEQLPYTQKIIDFISNNLAADEGFHIMDKVIALFLVTMQCF